MTAPYTTQAISGYNATPPSDDGSIAASNEVEWQKHLDKIGGPVKTLAEGMNTELLSAFGLIFGQNISVHSSNYTVLAADQGKFLSVTGTTTITLLAAATAGANFPLAIINNGTGVVTVDGSGAETINGSATVTLDPGNSIVITCNATLWVGVANLSQPDVLGYVKGVTEYVEADGGADVTKFDVSSVIAAAWESVGPTGSGATNIWTALDIIPVGAKWVELSIYNVGSVTGATVTQVLYGRVTGSSTIISDRLAKSYTYSSVTGATAVTTRAVDAAKIPVDSLNRFDLYRNFTGTTPTLDIRLIGWGI